MSEGEYRDNLKARVTAEFIAYFEDHPKLYAVDAEDALSFECPADIRKGVLFSLQKEGFIRMKGDRRNAYYERVFRRRTHTIRVDWQLVDRLLWLYGAEATAKYLHDVDPMLPERPTSPSSIPLPFLA